jgi:hypothetical protein
MSSSTCQENENNGFINEINIKVKHNINTHRKYDLTAASQKFKLLINIFIIVGLHVYSPCTKTTRLQIVVEV